MHFLKITNPKDSLIRRLWMFSVMILWKSSRRKIMPFYLQNLLNWIVWHHWSSRSCITSIGFLTRLSLRIALSMISFHINLLFEQIWKEIYDSLLHSMRKVLFPSIRNMTLNEASIISTQSTKPQADKMTLHSTTT